MFEDIFKNRWKLNSLISTIINIINNSYELFVNYISEENNGENNNELVITYDIYCLLKINYLNVKLTQYIKLVNKKYKEKKKELNDMINFPQKKIVKKIIWRNMMIG